MLASRRLLFVLAFAALGVFLASATSQAAASFTPQKGQTVAVLPFNYSVKGGLSGVGMDTDPKEASSLMREQVAVNLRGEHWNILEPTQVDSILASRGWSEPEALERAGPQAVGQALGADILCYGAVTRWGRHYLLIHSQAEVGGEIKLVSSETGKVLWSNKGQKVRTAGLTKIPTGMGAAAIAPIMGMQKAFLFEITNDLARDLTAPLLPAQGGAPPAAATPPKLLVGAAYAGSDGLVAAGDRIQVVAMGEPGQTATFAVGPSRRDIPMTEFGAGRYVGSYDATGGDHFSKTPITVNLFTRAGGLATVTLTSPLVTSRP